MRGPDRSSNYNTHALRRGHNTVLVGACSSLARVGPVSDTTTVDEGETLR